VAQVGDPAPPSQQHSRETWGIWLGVIGVIIFAGTLPATRLAVEGLNPYFTASGRAAVAGALAAGTLLMLRRKWPPRAQIRTLLVTGFTLVLGFATLMALSLQTVPASHGGVVLGILPLTTAMAAFVFLGERPSKQFWLWACIGTAIVVAFSLRGSGGHIAIGDIYMFAAALCASTGYALSGSMAKKMPGWEVICWVLVLALPVTLPMSLYFIPSQPSLVPLPAWAGFAYTSLFSMFIGFFAWNTGLAMGGVARVSQVQLLQIFITLGLSAVINGEHIDWLTAATAIAVVVVIALGRNA
jgi:drug/metabolite transporter (DMT)-like permease